METLFNKLSQYEIWNNILPGIALCLLLKYLVGFNLLLGSTVEQFFIVYLIGLINGRIDSLLIEPIFKKITPFRTYDKYVAAEKIDTKITTLSALNNKYRSLASVSAIVFVAFMCVKFNYNKQFYETLPSAIVLLLLILLFTCSFCKQTKYISKRIDNVLENNHI